MKKNLLLFTVLLITGLAIGQRTAVQNDDGTPEYLKSTITEFGTSNNVRGSAVLPQYFNYDTPGTGNSYPWNEAAGKDVQLLYLPGDFNQPTPAVRGDIVSISFRINENYPINSATYTDLTIKLGQSTITSFVSGTFYTGPLTTVYYRASVVLDGAGGQWMTIPLDTPFEYDPSKSLIVDFGQCGALNASGYSSCWTSISGIRRNWSDGGCPFSPNSTGDDYIYHLGINIEPEDVPISNWAIYFGIFLMGAFVFFVHRRRIFAIK